MAAATRSELIARRAHLVTIRDQAYATLAAGIANAEIENYTWQDAEAGHTVRRRSPKDINDLIVGWNNEIDTIDQLLSRGSGIHIANLRRIP